MSASPHIPFVSVVAPVHGTEATVGACLDGLLAQSLADMEVIVVDDASPDGARAVVLEYMKRDDRIILLENRENLGLFETRRRGAAAARGRYLAMCDSDDVMPPNALADLAATAEKTGADIVHGRACALADEWTGKTLWAFEPFGARTGPDFVNRMINCLRGWNLCGKLFRAEAWKRGMASVPERKGLFIAEDLLASFMIGLESSGYARTDEIVYCYRQPVASYLADSGRALRAVDDYLAVLTLLWETAAKSDVPFRLIEGIDFLTRHLVASMTRHLPPDEALRLAVANRIHSVLGPHRRDDFLHSAKRRSLPRLAAGVWANAWRLLRHGGLGECVIGAKRLFDAAQRHGLRTIVSEAAGLS